MCALYSLLKKKKTIPIPTSTSSLKIPLRHISDSAIRKQRRGASRTASLVASDQSRNRTEYSIVRKGPCSDERRFVMAAVCVVKH